MDGMKEKIIVIIDEEFCRHKVWDVNRTADRIISLFEKKCVWIAKNGFLQPTCSNPLPPDFSEYFVKLKKFKLCPYCGGVIQIEEEKK